MLKAFLSWATHAIGEEAFTKALGAVFSTVTGKATDKIVKEFFLTTDDADEQLVSAALYTEPMTRELRANLMARLVALKGRYHRNKFRIKVAQHKFIGDKRVVDVEATARILAGLAGDEDPVWTNFIQFMDLNEEEPKHVVVGFIKTNGNSAKDTIKNAATRTNAWLNSELAPELEATAEELELRAELRRNRLDAHTNRNFISRVIDTIYPVRGR